MKKNVGSTPIKIHRNPIKQIHMSHNGSTNTQLSELRRLIDEADVTHIHDEWTKMKFDEGKYKSTDIYSVPRTDERYSEQPAALAASDTPNGSS